MAPYKRNVKDGPSWQDIYIYVDSIQSSWSRFVEVRVGTTASKRIPDRLFVSVRSWSGWKAGEPQDVEATGDVFPHTDHATMEGLVMWLLYKHDALLTQRERARRGAAFF